MRTIKDVRFELKQWGNFWAHQEVGQGYASKSNIQAIKETLDVGCASTSDLHLFSHRSESIYVPPHIARIDSDLERLSHECRTAIRQRYVNRGQILYFADKETFLFWIRKAERELL